MLALVVAGGSGCGSQRALSQGEPTRSRSENLTFSYTQPANLPVIIGNPFPNGIAGSGYEDYAGYSDSDPFACRDCSYTNDVDLALSLRGQEQSRNLNTTLSGALTTYAGTLWTYGTNNGLNGRMQAAATDAGNGFSGSYASGLFDTIDTIKSLVELFPGAAGHVDVSKPAAKTWSIAFQPDQARAKVHDLSHYYNWQPVLFRELRFRGARTYCAMRQAAREQRKNNDTLDSLGAASAGSWWLWDYGNGETTVKVGAPLQVGKEPGQSQVTSTGANAFVVPVAIGTRVTPLSGPLFPDFPEIVHPLVWVTGDAEVKSANGQFSTVGYVNAHLGRRQHPRRVRDPGGRAPEPADAGRRTVLGTVLRRPVQGARLHGRRHARR